MSISHIQGGDVGGASPIPGQAPDVLELERRLREQTAANAQLDDEVRYLLQELVIRKEFIAQLEGELESLHSFAGRHVELSTEFAAYRRRIPHRTVDRLVDAIHRLPWLYRPLQQLGRVVVAIARRSRARTASPSSGQRTRTEERNLPTVDHPHEQR
ncbi:MAG TPA: hypothetical protein VN796_00185 [Acidimicrobiales bacterium]|nr:hypothetical protein [Acidimicrobiales bacterium]